MAQEDICPICRDQPRDIFITSCGHAFCGSCITRYIFFRTSRGAQVPCPACRQPVTRCETTSLMAPGGAGLLAKFQLGRATLQVDVSDGSVAARLSRLLKLPTKRLKFIHKGRVLTSDQDLSLAVTTSHSAITLLPRGSLPGPPWILSLLHHLRSLFVWLWSLLLAWTLPVRRFLRPYVSHLASICQPAWATLKMVLVSANPSYQPAQRPGTGADSEPTSNAAG